MEGLVATMKLLLSPRMFELDPCMPKMPFRHEVIRFCMYVCMYVCMNICTYVRTYECMFVCIYLCMYVCMNVCIYV